MPSMASRFLKAIPRETLREERTSSMFSMAAYGRDGGTAGRRDERTRWSGASSVSGYNNFYGDDVAAALQLNEMISPHNMANPNSTFWTLTKALVQEACREDDKDKCEKLLKVDTDTCNAITRSRGRRAGARCHASATERYAACLRDQPIPPLDTWNN